MKDQMQQYLQQFMSYWVQLRPREQVLLSVAGSLVLFLLVYAVAWKPLSMTVENLQSKVASQADDIVWMRSNVAELRRLQGSSGTRRPMNGGSMLGTIDSTAKSASLGEFMRRVEPDGNDKVRVWLEQAPFDDIAQWIQNLERNFGLEIETATFDKAVSGGRVSARIVFKGNS